MTKRITARAFIALIILVLNVAIVFAQTEPVDDTAVDVYPADYFDKFSPVTAAEMLERIPGISFILENGTGGSRGFGTNRDRILINGRRISGKETVGSVVLERIAADQVDRIEIIRTGSTAAENRTLDTQVNIVLKTVEQGTGTWDVSVTRFKGNNWRPGGKLTYAGGFNNIDYSIALKADPRFRNRTRVENVFLPDGTLTELSFDQQTSKRTDLSASGDLSFEWNRGDVFRLNGIYIDRRQDASEKEFIFASLGPGTFVLEGIEFEEDERPDFKWEIGGDYERPLSSSLKFKLLGLHNVTSRELKELSGDILASGPMVTGKTFSKRASTESIIRTALAWQISDIHKLEFGVEGVINTQDSKLEIFRLMGDEFVLLDVALSDSKVQEKRAEAFLVHNWKAHRNLRLQSALFAEFSEISQKGADIDVSRSFNFIKPAFEMRFDASDRDKLQLSIAREIKQLSFSNFVASVDDDLDLLEEGNPEIIQEKAWAVKTIWDHKLRNDGSSIRTFLFYDYVEDAIEEVALGDTDKGTAGNIGNGHRYGFAMELSLKLDWLHLPGAILEAKYEREWSSITDPFTEKKRRLSFSKPYEYSVEFRQDLTKWHLFYGISYEKGGQLLDFEINEIRTLKNEAEVDAFIEYKFPNNWRLRLEGRNLLNAEDTKVRERFMGRISSGILERTDIRHSLEGREVQLSLSGQF